MMDASAYIGIPYRAKGRSRKGIDCWGLCHLFYREQFNIEVPTYTEDYEHSEHRYSVAGAIRKHEGSWRKVDTPEPGDVLVFRIMGLPLHCGVYLGNGEFLHSYRKTETCIESIDSITWEKRLYGVFRWHMN